MLELADVVRLHGPDYLQKYGSRMLPSHRRALEDILACRTPAMGGHVFECDCCGHQIHAYHSCKNRSCPKCHTEDTREWIEKRREELIEAPYYHVVFTVPSHLHEIARANQNVFYSALMSCAAHALMKLCADPRYLGGKTAVMAVLHTWSRNLSFHPHVHCLIPAVAIHKGELLGPARDNFLVPVRALSVLVRGMLLDELKDKLPDVKINWRARRAKWVVYIKPAVQGSQRVLDYLGRYVHRIAIANSRITEVTQQHVTFRYQDSSDYKWKKMTLSGEEFLRRFLQHVLPEGFHKVRYYGLWAPANRKLLHQIQLVYSSDHPSSPPEKKAADCDYKCPRCREGTMQLVSLLFGERRELRPRAPP